ncbi:MAG: CPC_1213 family protein [Oscillospiraceae bacterium]|nr:CPC_1213 family protein [Oscillospiraceae bacterium]
MGLNNDNKKKSAKNKKKTDESFRSKHLNHDPQAESARAVYGLSSGGKAEPK